jgi:hypothetical protein
LDTPDLEYNIVSMIDDIISICGNSGTGFKFCFSWMSRSRVPCAAEVQVPNPEDSEKDLN